MEVGIRGEAGREEGQGRRGGDTLRGFTRCPHRHSNAGIAGPETDAILKKPPSHTGSHSGSRSSSHSGSTACSQSRSHAAYWRANLRVVSVLLAIWFVAGYVLSIFLIEPLNQVKIGELGLGFWMAQQGSIYVFVIIVAVYALWMDRLDRIYREDETS